jgi:hypothetical protein
MAVLIFHKQFHGCPYLSYLSLIFLIFLLIFFIFSSPRRHYQFPERLL